MDVRSVTEPEHSNVLDMAQWVRLRLGGGMYQNQRLLSSGAVKEMHTPQTIIPLEGTLEKLYPESEADLKKFVGKYALETPSLEVSIELVGNTLKANVPGQPVYTLVPVAANRFRIEGAPDGFFMKFEMAEGKPKSLTLVQGSGASIVFLPK